MKDNPRRRAMAEQYKTVREVIEMIDEYGIAHAMLAIKDLKNPAPATVVYATIEALIQQIDPEYFDEDDEDLYEIPIVYLNEEE
jgi:N-methylhydantoinase B/oxoprolinase/acetone carboxylase alpha subunit